MRSSIAAGVGIPAILILANVALAQPAGMPAAPPAPAQSETIIVAPNPPPPPREEVPPPPPVTTTVHVWEMGHWQWNGSDWSWIPGAYVVRPASVSQAAVWRPGYWRRQTDGWEWVEGHWE